LLGTTHSPHWGSPEEELRGELLVDMILATKLYACNTGNEPTFVRGIDVTMIKEELMSYVENWRVLDEESISLH